MKIQPHDTKTFFRYVLPAILSFSLSGVYSIVDGYFIGNRLGDIGLSAVTIVYPIVALIQAIGSGLGMGGAIYFSIYKAKGDDSGARLFIAISNWLMLVFSVILTAMILCWNSPALRLLGAGRELFIRAKEYIVVISLGTIFQIFGTGLVPFIRNLGGSAYAMFSMIAGFITNIVADYLLVWVWEQGMAGAAIATVVGQGMTMLLALIYLFVKRHFVLRIPLNQIASTAVLVLKVAAAPFGLAMFPNISLMIINRFSASYGGEAAIAVYACIAYMISVISLVLQGVGDGSQPLISKYYGAGSFRQLRSIRSLAYGFSLLLSAAGCTIMYMWRDKIGVLFGASLEVNMEVAKIIPIFLVSVPFVAIARITISSFYASKKTALAYFLIFIEPVLMLIFMLFLPPLFGGQIMIWWSTVFARILSASLAWIMKVYVDKREFSYE